MKSLCALILVSFFPLGVAATNCDDPNVQWILEKRAESEHKLYQEWLEAAPEDELLSKLAIDWARWSANLVNILRSNPSCLDGLFPKVTPTVQMTQQAFVATLFLARCVQAGLVLDRAFLDPGTPITPVPAR